MKEYKRRMAMGASARIREASVVISVAGNTRRMKIAKTPFIFGRSEECDAAIPDARVSRIHARIELENGEYFVTDAGSRHGTFVNGLRGERAPLRNNDEIRLGEIVRIVFHLGEPAISSSTNLFTRLGSSSDSSDMEKLRLFLEAARSLSSGLVVEDVLRNMLGYALKITRAERGFVYLKNEDGRPALACGLDSNNAPLYQDDKVSNSVVHEAMTSAAEFITGDASRQSELAERQSIVLNDLRTVIAIPLRKRSAIANQAAKPEVDGVLYLDSRSISRSISGVSHDVLRALASESAAVLESAKLVAAEQVALQHRKEMDIAASIQRSLISAYDVSGEFARVLGQSIPCKEVGGDFFDVDVSPDAVTVIVADVSGKGISAALLASVIHGMFYSQISGRVSLVNAVSSINRFLCSRVGGQKYATLMAAQLRRNGTLQIVNCGHVPAIIAQNGSAIQVDDGDCPVGLIPDADFHVIERDFPTGSRLCILTDGISETENMAGEEFGTIRVEECLSDPEPVSRVMNLLLSFSGHREAQDDRTMVILERTQ
jgi:sigma-B regulation protein RsbU (phosphoserine phosphatase)